MIHFQDKVVSTLEGFTGLVGVINVRANLSPLHSGGNVTLGNWMYEEFVAVPDYVFNGFFLISEDSFRIRKMTWFYKLFRRYKDPTKSFLSSKIIYVPTNAEFESE